MLAKRQTGLTLVEVLVALVLVAVAVSMFTYFVDALRLTNVSRQETQAAAYMRNYLDNLRAEWRDFEDYTYHIDRADPGKPPDTFKKVAVTVSSSNGAVVSYPGGAAPASHLAPLRTVTISVTNQQDVSLSLSTYIARPALNDDAP